MRVLLFLWSLSRGRMSGNTLLATSMTPDTWLLHARNRANRRKGNSINHHSGPKALSYRAEEFAVKGHPAPLVLAFLDAFAPNKTARPKVEVVKCKLDELLEQRAVEGLDVITGPISQEEQLSTAEKGIRPGTSIRGSYLFDLYFLSCCVLSFLLLYLELCCILIAICF